MDSQFDVNALAEKAPVVKQIAAGEEVVWVNPKKASRFADVQGSLPLSMADVKDAADRLDRFAPFIMKKFPETASRHGLIESALTPIPQMQRRLQEKYGADLGGRLLLKRDSDLAVAGSVKARGGIYEVLKHAEDLALEHGLLKPGDSYEKLASGETMEFFSRYKVQVGSTGNLGLSIGIMSAAVGFQVIVHMSADARQWKKDLLRSKGVIVKEYENDYSVAVQNGRKESDADPMSYFVDDENSQNLFLGYAVAAERLKAQLDEQGITVDAAHPLFVYIPCGVGGAPGGVTFGLKQLFGDDVHCFFVEPTQAPCMTLGMATGLQNGIAVTDVGLTGMTEADGLAVGRPSGFVGSVMDPLLSGAFTVEDGKLYEYMRDLMETEDIFIEPSSCALFIGPEKLTRAPETAAYLQENGLLEKMKQAVHIGWATGGALVPPEVRKKYMETYL